MEYYTGMRITNYNYIQWHGESHNQQNSQSDSLG